jgi:DDE_Tnp_1-associated
MTLNLAADAPLLQAFATLPDPRKSRNQLYPLIDILAVAVIGILCSANDWVNGLMPMKAGFSRLVFASMECPRTTLLEDFFD